MELVVGASKANMDSLLGKLSNLLAQEYALIRGVRGEIQYISDELASMRAFLLDLAQDDQDNRKKDWMKQIREMAYDCEDCIDDFAHRLPKDQSSNFCCKCSPWIATLASDLWTWGPRRQIASNIAELKVRAQLIAERRVRYGVENPQSRNLKGTSEFATYDIAEDQLPRHALTMKEPIGTGAVMEDLEKWVNKKAGVDRAVVSIVGFGGVGKTTIAMALYHKVMKDFDCRAWVTVSQNYDKGTVLTEILKQINPDHKEHDSSIFPQKTNRAACITSKLKGAMQLCGGNMQQGNPGSSSMAQTCAILESTVMEHLEKKKYIIVVDDIWSADTWDQISRSLPENKKGSRIIVTSRLRAVGATCCRKENVDILRPIVFLTDSDAEALFNQSISESISRNDGNEVTTQDLWKRCGGQPLAIVTMAGLVACNQMQSAEYWEELCKQLPKGESHITDGAQKQENSLTLDGVKRILDCCYNDLPGDLKTCLLYLSIFPKGWKISRKCVTRRWIAEGFVSKKHGLMEEEVAETYFNQLLRRKLIRPVDHGSNGKLKNFQVHDMVLDYISSKASEENFITVVGGHWMMPTSRGKVRRLSMQSISSKHRDTTKGMNLSQVRSLTVFVSLTQLPFERFNNRIIQVLDFHGLKGFQDKHMQHICQMLVIKYLSLRGTGITKIPPMIGKLEYLETLDIRETDVEELPKDVKQLKRISSILGGSKKKDQRKGLRLPQEKRKKQQSQDKEDDGMKGLRILSGIEINNTTAVASFYQLIELKKLTIYKLSLADGGQLLSSIEYLCSCGLQTLAINDKDSKFIKSLDEMSAPPRYLMALELLGKSSMLKNPPRWITKLQTLNKLTLSITVLRTGSLELLATMRLLYSLTFSFSAAEQDQDIDKTLEENKLESDGEIFIPEGFRSLKLLRLFARRVPKLGFCDNAMPALEMIEMRFHAFEGLFGIDMLKMLRGVHLREATSGRTDKDKKINEFLVRDLKASTEGLKVIVDHTFTY